MTRVRSKKRGHYWRDQGHYARKAVFYAYALLTLPVGVLNVTAQLFDQYIAEPVITIGHRIHVWANPCLYADTSKMPKKSDRTS